MSEYVFCKVNDSTKIVSTGRKSSGIAIKVNDNIRYLAYHKSGASNSIGINFMVNGVRYTLGYCYSCIFSGYLKYGNNSYYQFYYVLDSKGLTKVESRCKEYTQWTTDEDPCLYLSHLFFDDELGMFVGYRSYRKGNYLAITNSYVAYSYDGYTWNTIKIYSTESGYTNVYWSLQSVRYSKLVDRLIVTGVANWYISSQHYNHKMALINISDNSYETYDTSLSYFEAKQISSNASVTDNNIKCIGIYEYKKAVFFNFQYTSTNVRNCTFYELCFLNSNTQATATSISYFYLNTNNELIGVKRTYCKYDSSGSYPIWKYEFYTSTDGLTWTLLSKDAEYYLYAVSSDEWRKYTSDFKSYTVCDEPYPPYNISDADTSRNVYNPNDGYEYKIGKDSSGFSFYKKKPTETDWTKDILIKDYNYSDFTLGYTGISAATYGDFSGTTGED